MDLRDWIVSEHDAALDRFRQSVVSSVPLDRWLDPAGAGGSSIAFLTFHTALHEDVAMNAVVGGGVPLVHGDEWRDRLGLGGLARHIGLAEAEPAELGELLNVEQLVPYVEAVHSAVGARLDDGVDLEAVPASADGLARAGVDEADVEWLYRMWDGKPTSWFVQWEAIGHRVNHVGEMVSVRNRLGLSPF